MDMRILQDALTKLGNYFNIPAFNLNRKRRAIDPVDEWLSPKARRLHSTPMAKEVIDLDENDFVSSKPARRSPPYKTPPSRFVDTIVLDDENDIISIKKGNVTRFERRSKPNTTNGTQMHYVNGSSDDDDVILVKEQKQPKKAQPRISTSYFKPFTGSLFLKEMQNGTKPKELSKLLAEPPKMSSLRPSTGLNYSIRLDDKMQYKKLLEKASNSSSVYSTPVGKLFDYDTANQARGARMVNMVLNPAAVQISPRLSTRDTIKKVLNDFDDPIVVKDSDSESDIVIVNPPSPKPDIKVDPVNSLRKVVDTSVQTKRDWIDNLVERHRNFVQERQKEIERYKSSSDEHEQINKDIRLALLTDKVNRSLQLRDAVLPEEEKEEEVELPPLSQAQTKMVERAFKGDPNEVLAKKFNLNISRRDLMTLAGLNWLNDEVINFYMNLIIERGKDRKWPSSYAFNTFFYSKLCRDGPQSLRRWTKRVDLFAHDLVCVPIHLGMHWCMAVVDFRDRSIRYYDSMGGNNDKCLNSLRKYLESEHLDKKKASYDTSDWILENVKEIPQQMNGSDCGMFSCTFAEFLTRNAKIKFSQEHMPYLRKKMVVEIISGELLMK